MTPRNWEIWLVDMPFEDVTGTKVRPALVIDCRVVGVLVAKMTTHPPRSNSPFEYVMIDWGGAGLNRETTLRLSKTIVLPPASFLKKLGTVQPVDQANIWSIMKSMIAAYQTVSNTPS